MPRQVDGVFMINPKDQARALRYRRLALAESDRTKAALLLKLADEAEKGLLCTSDRILSGNDQRPETPKSVQ